MRGADQADRQRHAHHRADLPGHRGDRRAGGEARGRQRRRGGPDEGGQGQADAQAGEQHPGQQFGRVAGPDADGGGPPADACGEQQGAEGGDPSGAEPAHQGGTAQGDRRHQQRSGGDGESGAQCRVPPDLLAPQDRGQQHAGEGEGEQQGRGVGGGEDRHAQQRQFDDGGVVARRAAQEPAGKQGAREQAAQDPGREPAPFVGLDQGDGEGGDGGGEQDGAEQVGQRSGLLVVTRRGQYAGPHGDGGDADRDVDDEHPAPVGLDQQSAEDRSEAGGDPADRGPGPDGAGALGRGSGVQQQRERGRHQRGRARRLEHAGGVEPADGRGERAECGGDGEDGQPGKEHLAVADAVRQSSGGDQQRGEDDGVAVQHPGQGGQAAAVEVLLHRREGDVDDEQVEVRDEDRGGEHQERGAAVGPVAVGGCGYWV